MVKHIVMFKMKNFEKEKDFIEGVSIIRNRLVDLKNRISEIKSIEVGINELESPRAYDLVLITEFDSYDDLKSYQKHKSHLDVLQIVRDLTQNTIVVDYQYY